MKHLIYILFSILALSGCKKYIDEPDNSVITTGMLFNSSRDLDNLLYGGYGALASTPTLSGNWRVFGEVMADEVILNVAEPTTADPYTSLYTRSMNEAIYEEGYRQAYIAIQNANTVLYAIDNKIVTQEKDPEFNELTKARIAGEAFFIRAVMHFELVRLYGHQYGHNSTAANSGIVLRTKPSIDVQSQSDIAAVKRATVEEVYQQVISDLKQAEDLLPALPQRRGRASSFVAAAYLARVYFQMNDHSNALTQINKVIGSTPGSITTEFKLVRAPASGTVNTSNAAANVGAAFRSSGTGARVTENIFDLVSLTAYPVNGVMSRKYTRTGAINPQLAISNAFLTAAAFAANDARKVALISVTNGVSYSKKYDQSLMNIPVIRSSELLLDRAEINALNGNTTEATKDINLIRDRAIPGYNINTVIAPDKILEEVQRERLRELAFEGDRLHNLRRMKVDIGPGDRAATAPIPWNSNQLLFRFPSAEIKGSNGGVIQNPD
jgi:starch-binding outer membrane protein, SusD/RagB family